MQSQLTRTFITGDSQIIFIKIPTTVQNKKPSFDFEYEFISLKTDPKNFKKFLFESMIKVKRNAQFEERKKIFPKILSFYYLLKIDAEFIYAINFGGKAAKHGLEEGPHEHREAPIVEKYNDRRARLTPAALKVNLKAIRKIQG